MSGLQQQAVDLWCNAACSLGLISREGDGYSVSKFLYSLLADEDHEDYLGGQFSYLVLRSLDFDAFDDYFRLGKSPGRASTHTVEAFHEATKWDHTAFLKLFLPKVPEVEFLLAKGVRVLDLGSGTGDWIFRLAKKFPTSHFVGVEPDRKAFRAAENESKKQNLSAGRVEFLERNGESLHFEHSFDLVHLGEILCMISNKEPVLKRCFRALKPSGYLIVVEGLKSQTSSCGKSLADKLTAGMGLDFALQGARFLTKQEIVVLVHKAGFRRRPRFVDAGGGLWFAAVKK